jgi:hypothetical protein
MIEWGFDAIAGITGVIGWPSMPFRNKIAGTSVRTGFAAVEGEKPSVNVSLLHSIT